MHLFRFSLMFGSTLLFLTNLPKVYRLLEPSKYGHAGHEKHTEDHAREKRVEAMEEAGTYKGATPAGGRHAWAS